MTGIDRSALKRTSNCTDSVMSIAMSRRTRIVRVQEVQADTWRPMIKSMCSTGLSREMLLLSNELYVVVFVTGVMISPSVIRVAALVPDPTQQIKDGATYEMNELVFSPRCQYCVTLPH